MWPTARPHMDSGSFEGFIKAELESRFISLERLENFTRRLNELQWGLLKLRSVKGNSIRIYKSGLTWLYGWRSAFSDQFTAFYCAGSATCTRVNSIWQYFVWSANCCFDWVLFVYISCMFVKSPAIQDLFLEYDISKKCGWCTVVIHNSSHIKVLID